MNVAIIKMDKIEVGRSAYRKDCKMIDTVKSIKISHPKEFQSGNLSKGIRMEIKQIIRKHLLS